MKHEKGNNKNVPVEVIVSTKKTFTDTFINKVSPAIQKDLYKRIWKGILDEQRKEKLRQEKRRNKKEPKDKKEPEDEETEETPYSIFQRKMNEIPEWNNSIIDNKYNQIVKEKFGGDEKELKDLLSVILIFNVRILNLANEYSSNDNAKKPKKSKKKGKKGSKKRKNSDSDDEDDDDKEEPKQNQEEEEEVEVVIPNPKNFIHRVYINIARKLKTQPYLMSTENKDGTRQRAKEIQDDINTVSNIINKSIEETINEYLPVGKISKKAITKILSQGTDGNKPQHRQSIEDRAQFELEQRNNAINDKVNGLLSNRMDNLENEPRLQEQKEEEEEEQEDEMDEYYEPRKKIKTVEVNTNAKKGIIGSRTKGAVIDEDQNEGVERENLHLSKEEREMVGISNKDLVGGSERSGNQNSHFKNTSNEDDDDENDDLVEFDGDDIDDEDDNDNYYDDLEDDEEED